MRILTEYDIAHFWSKVDVRTPMECWPWRAAVDSNGYGNHKIAGKQIRASRASWMIANPEIALQPDDFVCHTCDYRRCVNPNHLFIGSAADNTADMVQKGRLRGVAETSEIARANQAKGAETKRRRTVEEKLPALLQEVARRLRDGEPTTYRSLMRLDGYAAARLTLGMRHSEIVEEAGRCA